MKLFIDSANIEEIRELSKTGLVDGVTTNPSLVAKTGLDFFEVLDEICAEVTGPVSAEVTATQANDMVSEGRTLAARASNIVVKIPLTWEGLKACQALTQAGIAVNVTLCFSAVQALLAAKAGARYLSPFIGRLDDIGYDGIELIAQVREIFDNYPETMKTEILAASIRHPLHVIEAAKLRAEIVTVPPTVLRQLVHHPLTSKGLSTFLADWDKTGQTITKR